MAIGMGNYQLVKVRDKNICIESFETKLFYNFLAGDLKQVINSTSGFDIHLFKEKCCNSPTRKRNVQKNTLKIPIPVIVITHSNTTKNKKI